MPASLFRLFLLATLALGLSAAADAQTGKISGRVTDAATGETIPGVNVLIEGTGQGAATNLDGEYVIIGVRPDTYVLTFSFVGYQTTRVEDVRVRIDLTTNVDAELQEEDLGLEGEIVVTAQRDLFERDVTATTAFVSGDEIRAIPVENFADVVELQAGVVEEGGNLHFRGGRAGEVGYWIDGVPVTDVYDGGLALEIENSSVQELQVVTGAFNAEYGQALSGIVNVVTRDGSDEFKAQAMAFSGDYATGEGTGVSASGELPLFPGTGVGDFDPGNIRNVEGSISGPILPSRLFFFASGRYFGNDGWINGRDAFEFDDTGRPCEPGEACGVVLLDSLGGADSTLTALNPYEKTSGQLKLTANLFSGIRLTANVLASEEEFLDGNFAYFLTPDAQPSNFRRARTGILKWTHLLSNTTFYEVGLTNNYTEFERYLFEDPLDPRYVDGTFIGAISPNVQSGFIAGGTDVGRFSRSTDTWLLKADLQSQLHPAHLVKTGVEFRRHRVQNRDQFTFIQTDDQGFSTPPVLITNSALDREPVEFAAYIQDKIEVGGLVVNAGLRFDYFDANGVVFTDPRDPVALFPSLRQCAEVIDLQCTVGANNQPVLRGDSPEDRFLPDEFFTDSEATWQISPRLGVAFPISSTGVFHFSYGQFFQVPNFELLYQNPFFQLSSEGSGLIGLIGNANLKPEQTINGEIGLKQGLTSTTAVELTAFYRDIRNLAGSATDPIQIRGTSARYGRLVNSDFGIVRGVVLRLDQRIGSSLFAGFDYTYQVARANAFDPSQVYNAAAAEVGLEQRIVPTPWDQRHTVNASLSYANQPLNAGFGLIANYGSGLPYTPVINTAITGDQASTLIPVNSELRPATFNVILSGYKGFAVAGADLQVFGRVENLFDTRNENAVFGDTGRATYTLEQGRALQTFAGNPLILQQQFTRPDFFSQPRRVTLGLRLNL
jgi:outer membrane receptor protein involved in Fe transport